MLQSYRDSMARRGSISPRLAAKLSAAQRFTDRGRTAQEAQGMQQFLDRLADVPANSFSLPPRKRPLKRRRAVLAGIR